MHRTSSCYRHEQTERFIGQFVTDLGAAVHSGMVVIGEKLACTKPSPLTR